MFPLSSQLFKDLILGLHATFDDPTKICRHRYDITLDQHPSPAWQVQFTRSEEIGIVIITMQHRLGIKRNSLYSTEVQHPFPLVRATLVHFYIFMLVVPLSVSCSLLYSTQERLPSFQFTLVTPTLFNCVSVRHVLIS